MASFSAAIGVTLLREGGYARVEGDSGGETYEGISRVNWPSWSGWPIIDHAQGYPDFPKCLGLNFNLQALVVSFYKLNFWFYDEIVEQIIANKVFDLSVNVGKEHAHKIVQMAVGVDPDGFFGPQTISAINATFSGSLLPKIIAEAIEYHKQIVVECPEDAKFLEGWINRDNAV